MSELKQKLLLYELAQIGFLNAAYIPEFKKPDGITEQDKIVINSDDTRMPEINNAGDIKFGREYDSLAVNTIRPLVDKVNEAVAAWERSSDMPFEELKQYRLLTEYNNIVLAVRDDTVDGRGLYFATWRYDCDRTGLENGYYTDDFSDAKENFAKRSGLVSGLKLFSKEQAAEIKTAIEYRLNNDGDITCTTENELQSIAARLNAAYPDKYAANTAVGDKLPVVEKPSAKPKTLARKLNAATEKVKAQETQSNTTKSHNREDRD